MCRAQRLEASPARLMLSNVWVVIKVCSDKTELHDNGAIVDPDFGCEGRVIHRFYTRNKTRPLLSEQGRLLTGMHDGYHYEDIAAVVQCHIWDGVAVSRREGAC